MTRIRTLLLRTGTEIAFHEISCIRGAVISQPSVHDVLYHNHQGDGFRYSYPLVQYKRIGGAAAILFIGEGVDKAAELFMQSRIEARIGGRTEALEAENVNARETRVQIWDDVFRYTLRKYLPLNQHNYEAYCQTDSVVERCTIIEKALIGNILSFAKGLDIHFDRQVIVKITDISEPRLYVYKGVRMTGFDVEFKSNVSLPDYIGLGKGVSLGYGMVKRQ